MLRRRRGSEILSSPALDFLDEVSDDHIVILVILAWILGEGFSLLSKGHVFLLLLEEFSEEMKFLEVMSRIIEVGLRLWTALLYIFIEMDISCFQGPLPIIFV